MDPNKKPLTKEEIEAVIDNISFESDDNSETRNLQTENDPLNENNIEVLYIKTETDSLSGKSVESLDSDNNSEVDTENSSNINQINLWSKTIINLNRFNFTGKSGFQCNILISNTDGILRPIDLFLTFISEEVLELMVIETNRYAEQLKNNKKFTKSSRIHRWKNTDITEMKKFIGIIMFMDLVNFPRIEYYWKKDVIYYHPLLHKIGICYNRFSLLLRCWHFVDNSLERNENSEVYKVQPLIDLILTNIRETYIPGDTVVIDETLIPFRGRLKFKQYNLSKSNNDGVKIYKLCTPKGFVYSFSVYCNQVPQIPGLDKPGSIVIDLAENLLNEGRLFITDPFYTSIPLALYLKTNSSDLCGMLHKNKKDIPKDVIAIKLKKGESIARQSINNNNIVTIIKWHDKRDVLLLSTCHGDATIPAGKANRLGEQIVKPRAFLTYNTNRQDIENSDQMSSYYSPARKSTVWYKKVAIELICGAVVVNSWLLYNEIITSTKKTLLQFTEKLVDSLLDTNEDETSAPETHFISKIPRKEGRVVRKRCVECYKEMRATSGTQIASKRTKQVDTECLACKKPFCIKCFENYHKTN